MNGKHDRIIGQHDECGGDVAYHATRSRGYRFCTKCKANTNHGDSVNTVEEAKKWRHPDES